MLRVGWGDRRGEGSCHCQGKGRKEPDQHGSRPQQQPFRYGRPLGIEAGGEDMIGFACSNTDLTMGPPGCREPFMGNNPFAFAFNAGEKYPEVCVDMATSGVAFGKCKDLAKRGKPIPAVGCWTKMEMIPQSWKIAL